MSEHEGCVDVVNRLGLHARSSALLVKTAGRFASKIELDNGQRKADAKSIMGVMLLAASKGTQLTLRVSGEDADEAYTAIRELFAAGFHEE